SEADDRSLVVDAVDDPAGVERPEAQMPYPYRHRRAGLDRSRRGKGGDPAEAEHLPAPQRLHRAGERGPALAEAHPVVIGLVAGRRSPPGVADLAIGEG